MNDIATELTEDLTTNQPDVQPHAVAAEAAKEQEARDSYADLRDRQGLPFDSSIHKTNGAGEPTLTKLGKLVRKPGRKPGSSSTLHKPDGDASTQKAGQTERAIAAAATVDAIGTIGGMVGGAEWCFIADKAQGIDERQRGIEAFEKYYEAKGINDVPPGVLILAWCLSYAAPRVMQGPITRGKLGRAKDWILSKVFKRRSQKDPETTEPASKKRANEMEA